MNRAEFKSLSAIRLREAKALIDSGHFDGAYYLCGYSVECALKACVAKNTRRFDFPDKSIATQSHTHDLKKLVDAAGLKRSLDDNAATNVAFGVNWSVVKDWSEVSRYKTNSRIEAEELFKAVNKRKDGVMSWIKRHW